MESDELKEIVDILDKEDDWTYVKVVNAYLKYTSQEEKMIYRNSRKNLNRYFEDWEPYYIIAKLDDTDFYSFKERWFQDDFGLSSCDDPRVLMGGQEILEDIAKDYLKGRLPEGMQKDIEHIVKDAKELANLLASCKNVEQK